MADNYETTDYTGLSPKGGTGSAALSVNGSPVSDANPLPAKTPIPADVQASGSIGALNAFVALTAGARDTLVAAVSGTFSATLTLQGSLDGATWFALNGPAQWLNLATGAYVTTITTGGLYQTTISAVPFVRLAATAYTSGTAAVVVEATDGNAGVALDAPLPAGLNLVGKVLIGNTQTAGVAAPSTGPTTGDGALIVALSPNYSSASNAFAATNTASTGAASVKTSAASLMEIDAFNNNTYIVFLKLYNKASAPTVGTDVPITVIPIPAGSGIVSEFGQYGKRFTTGFAYAVTVAQGDADATAPAASVKISGTYL